MLDHLLVELCECMVLVTLVPLSCEDNSSWVMAQKIKQMVVAHVILVVSGLK